MRVFGWLLLLTLAAPLYAQVIGPIKGFKLAEAYEAPHQTQLKFILEGAQAESLDKDHTLITDARLRTLTVTGATNLVILAPQALHNALAQAVSSPGPLRVQTADARFVIDGQGFLWRQTNSSLVISNRVHTVIEQGLLDQAETNQLGHMSKSTNGPVHIYSDRFTYEDVAGIGLYTGHVQVIGTNRDLALESGLLRVKVPALERQLQTITAETNVVIDYNGLHATGQRADYTVSNGLARITGQPTWRVAPREGRGDELVIDRTNRVFKANGHAWMKMPGSTLESSSFLLGTNAAPADAKATNDVVEIWSDNYEFHTNWGVFRKEVRVREHRDARDLRLMSCRLLTVTLAGTNELQSLVADGHVSIEQETNRLTGEHAVFTATNGLLELTGQPRWHAGLREGNGDLIWMSRDQMLVNGNAVMRLPAEELAASTTTRTNQTRPHTTAPLFAEIFSQDYTLRTNRAVFRGGVYATHPSLNLACELLDVQLGSGGGEIVTAEQGVVFDLKDEHGQTLHGAGDKAVYTVSFSGNATNALLRLTGQPAMMQTTNGLATASVWLLNRLTGDLIAPGGDYHLQGSGPALDTNRFVLPKHKISK